ncbi:integrase catalytic domain-containing protein [Trichonephila clavipes]|nr:integrase catalytic domain-containing protein [Trichonephila clavipes]
MITSKTRVAPVKSITLPRLELLVALLLSELYVVVLESLRKVIQIDKSFLFSDSQIVLDWLKSSPSRWKIFVANRILRIQKMTSEASWHHVKSQENPADCASRAWCKRFIKNCRSSRVTGVLTSKEVDDATKIVIQTVQESQFHSEIQLLKKKHPLPNSSKLLPLGIFLDTDGIIKVGGRLKNSSLSPIQKHSILLPKSHHLTNLVIQYFNHINLHCGPQLTLCCIRQKFWIPFGRGVIGRLLSKCKTCFRFKAKLGVQLMGNLPANGFSAGRVFLNVGIDFGGPFITKPNVPQSKEQLKLIKSVEVQNFVTQESITWHFIPPTAAHVGELWEAGIKSTKQLLIKTMKSAVLNFEELVTLVTQIEACLNSRPLTPLSNDPQDLQLLTPGHFLIGAPMPSFPEEVPSQPACLKKRWNLIQHLLKSVLEEMAPGVPKSITTKNQVE